MDSKSLLEGLQIQLQTDWDATFPSDFYLQAAGLYALGEIGTPEDAVQHLIPRAQEALKNGRTRVFAAALKSLTATRSIARPSPKAIPPHLDVDRPFAP